MGSFIVVKGRADPIQFVSDDSSSFYVGGNESVRIAGGNSIDTSATQDATDTITIALSSSINVNEISSTDSSAIHISDAVNMLGNRIQNLGTPVQANDAATKNYVDSGVAGFGPGTVLEITAGTGLTATPTNPITSTGTISLDFNTVVARVVADDSTGTDLRVGETIKIAGTSNITTAVSGDTLTITGPSLNDLFTVVGDDSTGTSFNNGETLKIAGTSNITTAMSGDTLTITGSKDIDINSISSTDSTAIQINDSINVSGTLTANSGLVANGITYPSTDGTANQVLVTNGSGVLSFTSLSAFTGLTFVGDDSTGSTINTAETLRFAGSNNITTAVVNDTVTITGSKDINVNSIASTDSTAIQINDAVNVSGLLTANAGLTINNNSNTWLFGSDGSTTLPAGGTITEGVVTSNPTIQLTPATPTVASQKLVIKGGGSYSFTTNGIEINYYVNTGTSGDTLIFYVYSDTYANQTLYWWIYPVGVGMTTPDSGTVVLSGSGGQFSIGIDSDAYEFTVRVSPEANNYISGSIGVESGLINADAPTFTSEHHLHLTTGNLTETSIFLGTDDHNVRTTTSGNIQITTPNTTNKIWEFGTNGSLTFPDSTIQNTAARITVVGDDSTGVILNAGETIKIAGAGGITTAVSGDVLTITGANQAQGITVVGDDSTGTRISDGETVKIAGTSNITTAMSGDTLTITGPDLSSYLTAVPKTIDINQISSGDSTAIQINDAVNILGTLTMNGNAITQLADPTAQQDAATKAYVDSQVSAASTSFLVADDTSTITTIDSGETLRIVGSGSVTTSLVGDTITITGAGGTTNYTFIGDDSTGTTLAGGSTLQVLGGEGISTAVIGNVLTITNTSTQMEIDGGSAYSIYNSVSEVEIDGGNA
jgi:hypothetical protein